MQYNTVNESVDILFEMCQIGNFISISRPFADINASDTLMPQGISYGRKQI